MELRHLRYFTTLAEELHYGRAAERLFIAQPALSKQIAALERELGVSLFDRSRRRVDLTSSGKLLLPEAQRLVELSKRFVEHGRRIRHGQVGTLRVGYTATVAEAMLSELLHAHHERCPDVLWSVHERSSQRALDDLRDGIFDAVFLRSTTSPDDLDVITVREEPAVLAVPIGHAMAAVDRVRFADLRDQPLVMMTRQVEPQAYDHAIAICAAAGFSPGVVHEADSVQTSLSMVASGLGLAVVTSSAQHCARAGVVYRPLVDPTPTVTLCLAYPRHRISPALAGFLDTLSALRAGWAEEAGA
jgi:DNA-binding transcriptional LysR family regulator